MSSMAKPSPGDLSLRGARLALVGDLDHELALLGLQRPLLGSVGSLEHRRRQSLHRLRARRDVRHDQWLDPAVQPDLREQGRPRTRRPDEWFMIHSGRSRRGSVGPPTASPDPQAGPPTATRRQVRAWPGRSRPNESPSPDRHPKVRRRNSRSGPSRRSPLRELADRSRRAVSVSPRHCPSIGASTGRPSAEPALGWSFSKTPSPHCSAAGGPWVR